ncbi:hypothetical protein TUM9757_42290 [Escherichia coli]|nr:hypothetical protein TUM9757_42290 [Escherichia coli]
MHELEVLLSRLKMEHLSYHVESLLEQAAKKELNYREFLCMALQQEWNGRHQRGMESRLKQARLPWVKTLEQFDFTFQPGIDRKVVRELAGLAFVERSENVILLTSWCRKNSSGHSSWRESGGCGTSGTVYATGQTDRDTDESETGKPAGASAAATELCPGVDPG